MSKFIGYRALPSVAALAFNLIVSCPEVVAQASNGSPDFGPNVLIFDPTADMAAVQSNLNAVFRRQEYSQFGSNRYAYFFKPGKYRLDVNVGFYTQVLGLGVTPGMTEILGSVHSEADWMRGNATCTFWRSCENLAVTAESATPINWAVSQGTSFRRMHIKGNVNLWDGGWSSGGFMADSRIDGKVNSGSQQQWFSRNDQWDRWTGANWNMMFVGVVNAPQASWPTPPNTVIERTPTIREKPFLHVDDRGNFAVRVPPFHAGGSIGPSWSDASATGVSVPINEFFLAHAGKDNTATINRALSSGKHLIFTPGIYHMEGALHVTHPDTIVLGLGLTTLVPAKGTPAMIISDVDGVKVAGIMIDAGPGDSPTLLQVGSKGSAVSHATNPICLFDVFCRVGGATAGKASTCVTINANHTIGDNLWLWRADHGAGANWKGNPSKNGLIVNGDNVTLYGLFVEHFQEYQTVWNGNGGRVFFYQNELPYDAPSQDEWQHDGVDGYAAYKVADNVTSHEAWALGVYGVFTRSPTKCFNAFETPKGPGIKMRHLVSLWITGRKGTEISHVLNGTGNAVNASNKKATID